MGVANLVASRWKRGLVLAAGAGRCTKSSVAGVISSSCSIPKSIIVNSLPKAVTIGSILYHTLAALLVDHAA